VSGRILISTAVKIVIFRFISTSELKEMEKYGEKYRPKNS
jgi:hypothetical protein